MDHTSLTQPRSFTMAYAGFVRELKTPADVALPLADGTDQVKRERLELWAVWDTGATNTVISKQVARRLGLRPIRLVRCCTVGGVVDSNVYLVSLFLPNMVCFLAVEAMEGQLEDCDLLIGMDIIGCGDFAVTHPEGKAVLSFRVPSMARIDFVQEDRGQGSVPADQPPKRNRPCPCGSGKKYKKCHGAP